jgi:carotenoid phi-ring synthase / carotenoid chi-ring synthase
VVGGGPAGLAAALALVEAGARVLLVERADRLGGRAEGWSEPLLGEVEHEAPSVELEPALHGLPEGARRFPALLARYGLDAALGEAQPTGRLDPAGRWRRERGQPWRALRGGAEDWIWRPLGEALTALGGELRLSCPVQALSLEGGRIVGLEAGQPGEEAFVPASGQPWDQARGDDGLPLFVQQTERGPRALWGRCPHRGCAVQREGAGFLCPCHGARFDADGTPRSGPPREPLPRLDAAAGQGGTLVSRLDRSLFLPADAVVLALEPEGLARLLPQAPRPSSQAWTVARFWLDRPTLPSRPAVAAVEAALLSRRVLLVHRLQDGAAAWARRVGGSVVELQAPVERLPVQALAAELPRLWPELQGCAVLKQALSQASRTEQALALPALPPGLFLAGEAWGPAELPPGLERAVASGEEAARRVLSG